MTKEELSHILDSLSGLTGYIYYHLMGEPLTHPELPDFLRMAVSRGFKPMITTNGTLLAERGDAVIEAGPHKVNISLHSYEGDDALQHERYLSAVTDFAKKAAEHGIIVVLRLWNNGVDGGKNEAVLDLLHRHIGGEWTENNRGLKLSEKLFLEWGDRFEWPDSDAEDGGSDVTCYGMRDHFGILADGTVVPCCLDSEGAISLGNVFATPLSEILASPRAQAIKQGFERRNATEALCRRCPYARRF